MQRRTKVAVGAMGFAALAGGAVVIPTSPAWAAKETCAGQGRATLSKKIFYPGLGPGAKNASFSLTVPKNSGRCTVSSTFYSTGTVVGGVIGKAAYCGQSNGKGTINGHHAFNYTSAGSMLIVSGPGATGLVNAVPDSTAGQSCTSGATKFLVTGVVNLK